MANEAQERSQILTQLGEEGRRWSDAIIMFHSAAAGRFGLNVTDWKCGGILDQRGPMTAGELAKATGLTTGAITGVIDRLEEAGFARREHDPGDRRRVIVHPVRQSPERMASVFSNLVDGVATMTERYTIEELTLVLDFMRNAIAITNEATEKLRAG